MLKKALFCFFSGIVLLSIAPGLIPPELQFDEFEIDEALSLSGPLEKNNYLDSSERILEGIIYAPESIVSNKDNEIYVTTQHKVVRAFGRNFSEYAVVADFEDSECEKHNTCGILGGLRFNKDGRLLVVHTGRGIFSLDVRTGKLEHIIDTNIPTEGKTGKMLCDVEVDDDGNIYWTESSLLGSHQTGLYPMTGGPMGRLLRYNPKTKSKEVLIRQMRYLNGLQMTPGKESILVVETYQRRVLRYWLKGNQKGRLEVFVSGLPGFPDNIKEAGGGNYYVSLLQVNPPGHPDLYRASTKYPSIRKFIMKILGAVKLGFDLTNYIFPNSYSEYFSQETFGILWGSHLFHKNIAVAVELNPKGEIVGSLQGYSGKVKVMSEVTKIGKDIFIGSPFMDFVGRLPVSRLEMLKKEKRKPSVGKHEL